MPTSPQVRALLGTVHDHTQSDIDKLKEFAQEKCKYMVIGFETCPTTGMQLKTQARLNVIQALVNPREVSSPRSRSSSL